MSGANPQVRYDTSTREELIAELTMRLAQGEPMAVVCRDSHMPTVRAVFDWAEADPLFATAIARARQFGADAIAIRARQTARGFGPENGGDSTGDVQRDKLIVDTDLKLLAKWNPKQYGDAVQLRHAGADGEKLDTAPLVAQLMGLMAPGQQLLPPEPSAEPPKRLPGRSG